MTNTQNFVFNVNNKFPSIKFTYSVENNKQPQFLDVLAIKNNILCIYNITRYIPKDSHHYAQHQVVSFNFYDSPFLRDLLEKQKFEKIYKGCSYL